MERGIKGLIITEGWSAMATPASLDGVRNWKELGNCPPAGGCAEPSPRSPRPRREEKSVCAAVRFPCSVGGGVRIHPEKARMSGRHGVQYVAQCVACAALAPVVWQ